MDFFEALREIFDECPRPHHHVFLVVAVRHKRHHHRSWRIKHYRLEPNREVNIMTDVTVGHEVIDTIVYMDQNGNPMLVTPVPDAPPVWANIAAATVDTLTVSADGSTATLVAVGAGVDSVALTLNVGGVAFSATQQLNITAAPQVLTSVGIAATVQ